MIPEPRLRIECCACHRLMGYRPCLPAQNGQTSHGYCRPCFLEIRVDQKSLVSPELEADWAALARSLLQTEPEDRSDP